MDLHRLADPAPLQGLAKRAHCTDLQNPFTGTATDFASNDPIEQAIGPDPFKPIPFRSWLWDAVPGVFPAPVFDVANRGEVMRHSVMTVDGGSGNVEQDRASAPDANPPWDNLLVFNSACNNGIVFAGDTSESAILFAQPNGRAQPIKWLYENGKEATLTVSPADGTMRFEGNGMAVPGGLTSVGGLSGSTNKAANLRGIGVPVKAGSGSLTVPFPNRESDAAYAVFVQLSWLSRQAVTEQTATGFTVTFDTPPAKDETLHWLLVR